MICKTISPTKTTGPQTPLRGDPFPEPLGVRDQARERLPGKDTDEYRRRDEKRREQDGPYFLPALPRVRERARRYFV